MMFLKMPSHFSVTYILFFVLVVCRGASQNRLTARIGSLQQTVERLEAELRREQTRRQTVEKQVAELRDRSEPKGHSLKSGPGRCEWKLVYKTVSGNGRPLKDGFLKPGSINRDSARARDIRSTIVFRDGSILDNWSQHAIERVKIELYKNGRRRAWFLYDGVGSTINSWMSKERLIASPYRRIKEEKQNFHSVRGDQIIVSRPFFINRNYGGCPRDCGFLITVDIGKRGPCRFDSLAPKPYFLFGAKTEACSNWHSGQYQAADRFVVLIKECPGDI